MVRFFKRRGKEPVDVPEAPAPSFVDPVYDDPAGARLVEDVTRRDWREVHNFLSGIEDPDRLQHYVVLCSEQNGVQAWIDDWIEGEPKSFLPFLVGGSHAIRWAWLGRGFARAHKTLPAQFRIFERRLGKAHEYLMESIARNPDDPTAWAELVTCAKGMGLGIEEAAVRFDQAVVRHRWHFEAHKNMLSVLLEKWGGSHEMSCEFAEGMSADAPPSSGLATLVPSAHMEHWGQLGGEEGLAYIESDEVADRVRAAAERSVLHPDHRRRVGWQYDFNFFAMAAYLSDQYDLSAEMFDAIGDQITKSPWNTFYGDPVGRFLQVRRWIETKRTPSAES